VQIPLRDSQEFRQVLFEVRLSFFLLRYLIDLSVVLLCLVGIHHIHVEHLANCALCVHFLFNFRAYHLLHFPSERSHCIQVAQILLRLRQLSLQRLHPPRLSWRSRWLRLRLQLFLHLRRLLLRLCYNLHYLLRLLRLSRLLRNLRRRYRSRCPTLIISLTFSCLKPCFFVALRGFALQEEEGRGRTL